MPFYVAVVDSYRRPSRKRRTAGLYFVFDKNEKKAKATLQNTIGFGSIRMDGKMINIPDFDKIRKHGNVFYIKHIPHNGKYVTVLLKPYHATDRSQYLDDLIRENLVGVLTEMRFTPIKKNSAEHKAVITKLCDPET